MVCLSHLFMFKICIYHWIWIEFFISSLQYSIVQTVFSMVAFLFSRGPFQPRDWTQSPALQVDSLPAEPQGKPKNAGMGSLSLPHRIFLIQELNQGLQHFRWILYQLSHEGSPTYLDNGRKMSYVFILNLC